MYIYLHIYAYAHLRADCAKKLKNILKKPPCGHVGHEDVHTIILFDFLNIFKYVKKYISKGALVEKGPLAWTL
jgi:hypothetical protein